MNRSRNTLGPSKATSTTTCQKCLQKGHYSYECKTSLQSRPYVSRASRSQQLRNPKLKPILRETKLNDPPIDPFDSNTTSEGSPVVTDPVSKSEPAHSVSRSVEPPSKRRRRSVSSSSTDSVSTISTTSSHKDDDHDSRARSKFSPAFEQQKRSLDELRPRLRSPNRMRTKSSMDRSRSPHRVNGRSRQQHDERSRSLSPKDQDLGGHISKHVSSKRRRDSHSQERQRSESPDRRPNVREQTRSFRQRSLSPYSRRLALTHAMNATRADKP